QLGKTDLANRLADLTTSLTSLVQSPASTVFKQQALGNLDSILSQLSADAFLSSFSSGLGTARTELAAAVDVASVQAAVLDLGGALTDLQMVLADEAAHGFTASLSPNSQVAQPTVPAAFDIVLQNTGTQTTTYDVGLADQAALPSGVTFSFS